MTAPLNLTSALYDHFRKRLFGILPDAIVLIQNLGDARDDRLHGFYCNDFYKKTGEHTHVIWLRPGDFADGIEWMSLVLVHEMVHLWQAAYAPPERRAWHDQAYAAKMQSLGLLTVAPDGGRTGEMVDEIVVPDGPFARAVAELPIWLRECWQTVADAFVTIEGATG
jgi:hypothetical protein